MNSAHKKGLLFESVFADGPSCFSVGRYYLGVTGSKIKESEQMLFKERLDLTMRTFIFPPLKDILQRKQC